MYHNHHPKLTVFFVSFREHLKKNFLDRPCITPRSLRRLYRVLIPGPCDYRHYRYAEAVIEKIVLRDRDLRSARVDRDSKASKPNLTSEGLRTARGLGFPLPISH